MVFVDEVWEMVVVAVVVGSVEMWHEVLELEQFRVVVGLDAKRTGYIDHCHNHYTRVGIESIWIHIQTNRGRVYFQGENNYTPQSFSIFQGNSSHKHIQLQSYWTISLLKSDQRH